MPGASQLQNPLDKTSIGILRSTLDERVIHLLTPLETAAANEGTSTLLNYTPCIQLADGATNEAYFAFIPHEDLLLASMFFVWSTPATSGNLYWKIDIGEGGIGEATNVRTTGGTSIATAAKASANVLNWTAVHSASGVNLSKLKRGTLWGIKFTRSGADASDTLSNTANLYGIQVTYRLFGV